MIKNQYKTMKPFFNEAIIMNSFFLGFTLFGAWFQFRLFFYNIGLICFVIYIKKYWILLFNITKDNRNDYLTKENLYVSSIQKVSFDVMGIKDYWILHCHKVNRSKFTDEKIILKSSNLLPLKEKEFRLFTYFTNSMIIYRLE